MSSHKKAASTIIKEQAAQIAELEKRLKTAESTKDMYYQSDRQKGTIIDEIHTMLDAVPVPPPRKSQPAEGTYRSESDLSLLARLTIFMSRKDV
jgi:hypothetical protein